MRSWGGAPRGEICQRGAGRGGAGAGRGPAAAIRKVMEGNELFRDGPLDTLGDLCTGTQKGNASRNGRNGRFWDREKEGELRRLGSRSFCPWHPLPFSPHPADLHSSLNPLGRTGCSGHTCTAGLASASSPPASGPAMASSQGSGAQDVC